MRWFNLKMPEETLSFGRAALRGLGTNRGLFMPSDLDPLPEVESLLDMAFLDRCAALSRHWLGDEMPPDVLVALVRDAFDFPLPMTAISDGFWVAELFHGPTLAFKDFGARFMARVLAFFRERDGTGRPTTILTATSGDTGAAVAHAFHGLPGIRVVVLYPKGRISRIQEQLFCTLGGNIRTLAVEADFDNCQELVKSCFDDTELVRRVGLNSANSINAARLLAQVFYYFEIAAKVRRATGGSRQTLVCVPSGNFGNLTAGLLAKAWGAPIAGFIAATNANDTVPRYLRSGQWRVRPTVATLSNAMDISTPNNWPRTEYLLGLPRHQGKRVLRAAHYDDEATRRSMRGLFEGGYLADPHTAIACAGLADHLGPGQVGVALGTAHPGKFHGLVAQILGTDFPLPQPLRDALVKPNLSETIAPDPRLLTKILLEPL